MLHHLSIRNFAIVDAIDLELGPGMTAITGETGAGKSLLVDALHLLLGGRADSSVVRAGAAEAVVSGFFTIGQGPHSDRIRAVLAQVGIDADAPDGERELLVRRSVSASGRGRAYVDDVLITVATLRALMEGVVDIMSQHEHQSLASRDHQLDLLDAFAEHGALRQQVAARYDALRALCEEKAALALDEAQKVARIDYLEYQLGELREIDPQPGEAERLDSERKQLGAVDRLRLHAEQAEAAAYGDDLSATARLAEASHQLRAIEALDPKLASVRQRLDEASALASDAGQELGRFLSHLEADPERLASVEDRLDAIKRLARKHAVGPDQLAAQREELEAELDRLQHAQSRLDALEAEVERARAALQQAADQLSAGRRRAAATLSQRCATTLAELAMAEARIEVAVEPLPPREDAPELFLDGGARGVARHGADRVELLLQANPGEPARPLLKVASGGELSRVALALRRVLADRDAVPTYVFDEVDAAIGGATAEAVGLALKQVAASHQVLCITHLPQVASLADRQLRVEKAVEGDRTHTVVRSLDASERVDELARMLGGAETTETARKHARSLLKRARP